MGMQRKQAVSYLRVSTTGQVDGDGFERQRLAISQFAKRSRLELVDEYRDEGVSGSRDLGDREGLTALLSRVMSNGVRIVVVERADRLARDLVVSELIIDKFTQLGVQIFDSAGNDLTATDGDPTRVLVRQILAAIAQFDKSTIVAKLAAARARKRKLTGRCEGPLPFGGLPGEQAVVDRARELIEEHRAGKRPQYAAVARALNAEGQPTRTGAQWSGATVKRMLNR